MAGETVGYVVLEDDARSGGLWGALLLVSGSNRPLGLYVNGGSLGAGPFWQGPVGRRHLSELLVSSLLEGSPLKPDLIVLPAKDWPPEGRTEFELPVALVEPAGLTWKSHSPPAAAQAHSVFKELEAVTVLETLERTREQLRVEMRPLIESGEVGARVVPMEEWRFRSTPDGVAPQLLADSNIEAFLEWHRPLLPYQRAGVKALVSTDRILLADDMGLGKTIQAISAIRILFHRGKLRKALVVAPAGVINQWRRELRLWSPELRFIAVKGSARDRSWQWRADVELVLVSFETLRSDAESPIGPARTITWDLVVLDEAQKIKNADTSVSTVCKSLKRRRSWAMTGTPLENRLEELASILEFVDQEPDKPRIHYGPGTAMLARHAQLQIRRRKVDVLTELPPKRVIDLTVTLSGAQKAAYDQAEQEGLVRLREKGPLLRVNHVLELILRLKQLCNFSPSGKSAKAEDIRDRLETLVEEGHRTLIFSQFKDDTFGVEALAGALVEFKPLIYTGSQNQEERDWVVRRFVEHPEHKALILSLRAGGTGLNLQAASYVFHLDRWWNPAVEHQAEDRSHRMGQVSPVTVFKYTCEGTIEERIRDLIDSKQRLFDEVVDDVSMDLNLRLSAEELFGLFGLEPTASEPGEP